MPALQHDSRVNEETDTQFKEILSNYSETKISAFWIVAIGADWFWERDEGVKVRRNL